MPSQESKTPSPLIPPGVEIDQKTFDRMVAERVRQLWQRELREEFERRGKRRGK